MLYKQNTCLFQTAKLVPRRFSSDRFHSISYYSKCVLRVIYYLNMQELELCYVYFPCVNTHMNCMYVVKLICKKKKMGIKCCLYRIIFRVSVYTICQVECSSD